MVHPTVAEICLKDILLLPIPRHHIVSMDDTSECQTVVDIDVQIPAQMPNIQEEKNACLKATKPALTRHIDHFIIFHTHNANSPSQASSRFRRH